MEPGKVSRVSSLNRVVIHDESKPYYDQALVPVVPVSNQGENGHHVIEQRYRKLTTGG